MPHNCDTCDSRLNVLIKAHDNGAGVSHATSEPCERCDKMLSIMGRQHADNVGSKH